MLTTWTLFNASISASPCIISCKILVRLCPDKLSIISSVCTNIVLLNVIDGNIGKFFRNFNKIWIILWHELRYYDIFALLVFVLLYILNQFVQLHANLIIFLLSIFIHPCISIILLKVVVLLCHINTGLSIKIAILFVFIMLVRCSFLVIFEFLQVLFLFISHQLVQMFDLLEVVVYWAIFREFLLWLN